MLTYELLQASFKPRHAYWRILEILVNSPLVERVLSDTDAGGSGDGCGCIRFEEQYELRLQRSSFIEYREFIY